MSKKSESAEQHIKSVKRRTRRKYSAEEKIRIVLEGMRGEHSIAELCRREGIALQAPPRRDHENHQNGADGGT